MKHRHKAYMTDLCYWLKSNVDDAEEIVYFLGEDVREHWWHTFHVNEHIR